MLSAIYLVCFIGEPCKIFADPFLYPTIEECTTGAATNMNRQLDRAARGEIPEFTVEHQCIPWDKA